MTIAEIALKAGVSIGTVDRVIHNRGRVASSTKAKIQNIISETEYQPNPLARQLKCKTQFTIGALFPSIESGSGYWQQLYNGMEKAVNELSPFSIGLRYKPFQRTTDRSLIDNAILLMEEGVNALVIAPVVPDECLEFLSKYPNIPYIFVDSPLNKGNPLATIAQNPYQGGRSAGRIMKLLKGNGMYASLRMYENAYNLRERCRGFTDYLTSDSACSVIEEICIDQSEEGITSSLDNLFATYSSIKGLFVAHAEVHHVGRYLVEHDLKRKVALIGYDLLQINEQALLDEYIDCIISQRPEYQGSSAVYELYKSELLHQQTSKHIKIPIDIFFKENIV